MCVLGYGSENWKSLAQDFVLADFEMEQWSGLRHQSQSSGQIDRNKHFIAKGN